MMTACSIICVTFQLYKRHSISSSPKDKSESVMKDDIRSSEEVDLMHWNTVGNYIGQMIVIAYHLLQASVFRHMFFSVPGKVSGVIITLPVLSSFLGCILAYSFKKTVSVSKVIAIVCELQNVKRILVIISRSFDVETQRNAILLPWLYRFLLQRIKKE
ncbi:hypothetical protein HNY73_021385 [Argiope bruennichi]|uniref:Uncharacterized protein n=1 Tax=Argiope bruennichi TaxID=94029 RepID=A0A8T0DXD7_ARGBR|nr:hypothetical protein HNY73_021385 [Argiope bruennichi]